MNPTKFPVQDPKDPHRVHIVSGSEEAIAALQALIQERFRDGRNLGRAEAEDAYNTDPGPEARGETPLPLELSA